jgi:hypothetical protein
MMMMMMMMMMIIIIIVPGVTGIVTKGLKKISVNNTRKAFHRFSAETSSTGNITCNKESSTV